MLLQYKLYLIPALVVIILIIVGSKSTPTSAHAETAYLGVGSTAPNFTPTPTDVTLTPSPTVGVGSTAPTLTPTITITFTPSPTVGVGSTAPTSTPIPSPTPTPDTEAPAVIITSPPNGSIVLRRSTVVIVADAHDNVGVTFVQFLVNNVLTCTDTTAPYQCSWVVPNRKGLYTLTARAFDKAGNVGQDVIQVTAK